MSFKLVAAATLTPFGPTPSAARLSGTAAVGYCSRVSATVQAEQAGRRGLMRNVLPRGHETHWPA